MTTLNRYAGLLLLIVAVAPQGVADDWPTSRGDQAGTGVAKKAVPGEPEELWTYKVEDASFEVTPVIESGVVYLGDAEGTFHAIDLATGAKRWSAPFEETFFLSPAAVRGDRLVVTDFDGVVRCLAIEDGAELWSFEIESEAHAGPVFHGDNVLLTTESGELIALRLKDGQEQWRYAIDAPLRCSPTIVAGRILLAGCDARLHAVDAATGKALETVEIGAATGNTAASRDGRSFFGTEGGAFLGVDARDKLHVAWTYHDERRGQGIRTAAAVSGAAVVFASQGKRVYAVDPQEGALLWSAPFRSRIEAAPVIAGERVIVATRRGRLLLLDLVNEGKEVWQYEAGGQFLAAPAVVDGKIVIANGDGVVYCFGSKSKSGAVK